MYIIIIIISIRVPSLVFIAEAERELRWTHVHVRYMISPVRRRAPYSAGWDFRQYFYDEKRFFDVILYCVSTYTDATRQSRLV